MRGLLAMLGLLALGAAPALGQVQNGNFSAGLTGWTADPGVSVNASGQADLKESSNAPMQTLQQTFIIPAGTTGLLFEFRGLTSLASGEPASAPPIQDAFTASLYDSANNPVLNSVPGADYFYTDRLNNTVLSPFTTRTAGGSLDYVVSLNVSSLAPGGYTLYFDMLTGSDGYDSSMLVDNVQLISGPVVPLPTSVWMGVAALGVMTAVRAGRRYAAAVA